MSKLLQDTEYELKKKIKARMEQSISEERENRGHAPFEVGLTVNDIEDVCSRVCIDIIKSLGFYMHNRTIESTMSELGMKWNNNRQRLNFYDIFNKKLIEQINYNDNKFFKEK